MRDLIIVFAVLLFCAALIAWTWYTEGIKIAILTALAGLVAAVIAPFIVKWIRNDQKT